LSATPVTPDPERRCFHCGLPVPPGGRWRVEIGGEVHPLCCPGCEAVAQAILDQGLGDYYRHREGPGRRPDEAVPDALRELVIFDDAALQRDFVREGAEGSREASLAVEGITCAACAWLIERHLGRQPGVRAVSVSLASHRARLVFDPEQTPLSRLLLAFSEIGYVARPYSPDRQEALLREEERRALRRLGVAGLASMQVMMFAVGLYAGALQGIEERYRDFLRGVSLLVATPVVFYSARPFFAGALRDLRGREPGMDVPVALAIGSAYLASALATLTGRGEVYFDSVCMFTFFLGLGRYLEMRVRHRSDARMRRLLVRVPQTARRMRADGAVEVVPLRALAAGDRVRVRAGETLPADGVVEEGEGALDESLLTGEPMPRARSVGDAVLAGSQNVESPLVVRVTRVGRDSTMATLLSLLDRAQGERPQIARIADRVARFFVAGVVATAAGVGLWWWATSPADAFRIVLSVLVVTCPCALSLATPAALAAASNGLAGIGLLATRGHTLETLARVSHVVFDKTGTLTRGAPSVTAVHPLRGLSRADVLARARLLESHSEHPLARAFAQPPDAFGTEGVPGDEATRVRTAANLGVEGLLAGRLHRIGRPDWALALSPAQEVAAPPFAPIGQCVLLADEEGALAWFELRDEPRTDAAASVAALGSLGLEIELLSGDPSPAAAELAARLGIHTARAGASPQQKLDHVRALQARGAVVAMVGDGINDAPVLAQAQVSIAMGSGSDLARIHADAILLGDGLDALVLGVGWARKTTRVIRENLAWALVYNLAALPLAACGYVAPWMAAVGMSASSLLVVANALRLSEVHTRS